MSIEIDTIEPKQKLTTKINIDKKHSIYPDEIVIEKCTEYFKGDKLAATTWINKYAMKNKNGKFVESTPDEMHNRMAHEFARIESQYKDTHELNGTSVLLSDYGQSRKALTEEGIYQLFKRFKYVLPQGSVMAGLGNPYMLASLSNCVLPL